MLKQMREGQRWLTALFVVALGGVFVFFLVPGSGRRGPSGGALLEVGPYRFGVRDFEAERARRLDQYRRALGDDFDSAGLEDTLNDITTRVLIERAILAQEARRLGFLVSKQEVERLVVDSFRGADGRFDREAFNRFIQYEYGSERNFMAEQRMSLLALKMLRMLEQNAQVSDAEVEDAVRRRLEEVRIAFVALDAGNPTEEVEVSEAQVEAFLATREEEARTLYHQRSNIYDVPEQVHARHILLAIPPDASEERLAEVEAKAQEALQRLRAGADFAEVAAEISDDPGSKESGGDLGFFRRGQMVKPFEDAAFSQEPGTLSDPVRSDFGIHIIRVEEHLEAAHTPFEEVRDVLARELVAREAAAAALRERAEGIAAAVRGGQSLEAAARADGLTLERSGWLRRRADGFVPGLGAAQDLLIRAFTLAPGESADRVFEVGDKLALVQVLERRSPDPESVEKAIESERQQLRNQKRQFQTRDWVNARREKLIESGRLIVDFEAIRGDR